MALLALALPGCSPTSSTPTSLFLTIIEPADESVLDVNTVTIRGQTLAGAIVSINGDPADVESNGSFSLAVTLEEGPNVFDIIATNQAEDEVTSQLIVYFAP